VSTFAQRREVAQAHEDAVLRRLRRCGYLVEPYGQGNLSHEMRTALRRAGGASTSLRWLPDGLAVGGGRAILYDAKASFNGGSPFWHLEVAAHASHVEFQKAAGIRIVIVWDDYRCSWVDDLTPACMMVGKRRENGSGTPYWSVPKRMGRQWDTVFPFCEDDISWFDTGDMPLWRQARLFQ
jgi:hypothetical protein